jgi:pimeloyl-ACP methyl ester carboxylesterase
VSDAGDRPGFRDLTFTSGGVRCAARHLPAADGSLASGAGRPVVVMAHGLAGTVDSGLEPFAARFAAAGLDVLAFDYRGFGASEGSPRQSVSIAGQVADYRAAMAAAAGLPGVDPGRLVLWGVSLSGGHVLAAGAGRDDVAAVVSLTPLVDGLAAARHAMPRHGPDEMLRSGAAGVRSRFAARRGRPPVTIPVVGKPGDLAAFSLEGCYEDYVSLAGPTWRNEIDAGIVVEFVKHRPGRSVRDLRCPLLVQIADFDRLAPPAAAARTAFRGRGQVRHYPCDHFDVWPGKDWFEAAVTHEVRFLRRALAPTAGP